MKKAFLLSALIIPMVIGCNKNSAPNFDGVFPNDEYKKVGFKIADDEKTTRALTTLEITTIENTVKNIVEFDKYINRSINEVHQRSYMKAFAGEYSQGMNVKNILNDKTEEKHRNDYKKVDETIYPRRLITESTSKTEEQYNYGAISKNEKITTYIHEEIDEEIQKDPPIKIFKRTKSEKGKGQSLVTKVSEETIGEYSKPEIGDTFYLISQKDYIKETDIHSGANDANQIIIVKEDKVPYPGEKSGFIKLEDQREFCALKNSISVAKLELIKVPTNPQEWQEWKTDWYLVNSVRKYTETVITSEVIEPNVPISYLSNPVTINYQEERQKFFVEAPKNDKTKLPKITEEYSI